MCLAGDSGRVPSNLGLQLATLAALRWIVKGMVLCSNWELLRRGSWRVIFAIVVWLQRLVPLLQANPYHVDVIPTPCHLLSPFLEESRLLPNTLDAQEGTLHPQEVAPASLVDIGRVL